jgi:hypothetical protein
MKICSGTNSPQTRRAYDWAQLVTSDPGGALSQACAGRSASTMHDALQLLDFSEVQPDEELETFGPPDPDWS